MNIRVMYAEHYNPIKLILIKRLLSMPLLCPLIKFLNSPFISTHWRPKKMNFHGYKYLNTGSVKVNRRPSSNLDK